MSKVSDKNSDIISIIITVFAVALLSVLLCFFAIPANVRSSAEKYAEKFGIDGALVIAIVKTESGFYKDAVSKKGACGLMQIMPSTFGFVAEKYDLSDGDIFDPDKNLEAGCAYLRYLFDIFATEKEALCAYNAGEGTVRGWLLNSEYSSDGKTLNYIPFKETDNYIKKIKFYYSLYRGF